MKRSDAAHLNCSIARGLDVVGEWWTLLIVRDAFFGVRRFEDFVSDLGISRGILTDRLATLVDHDVLERHRYQHRPDRYEYRLTEKGHELFPVLMALMRWGDRWLSTDAVGGPPVVIVHSACGHDVSGPQLCAHCHVPIDASSVSAKAGPGASPGDRTPPITNGAAGGRG